MFGLNNARGWFGFVMLALVLLATSGCQSLNFPWGSTPGLPTQWEPEVQPAEQ